MMDEWDGWLRGKKDRLFGQHELPGRIRVGNSQGKFNPKALEELGWSKHKLTNLLNYIQENMLTIGKKFMELVDGTQIKMKEVEGNTQIDIVVPEKEIPVVKEKLKKEKVVKYKYIAPAILCYSYLPDGKYYFNNVPELFAVMPNFRDIRFICVPRDITLLSDEISSTYIQQGDDPYGYWYGKVKRHTLSGPPEKKWEIKIKELWNVGKNDSVNITGGTQSSGTITFVPPESETEIGDGFRTVSFVAAGNSWIDVFGNNILTGNRNWNGQTSQQYIDGAWISLSGVYASLGKEINLGNGVTVNPGIRDSFASEQQAYMLSYYSEEYDYNESNNPVVPTYQGAIGFADQNNNVPQATYYRLFTKSEKFTNDVLLWQDTSICYDVGTHRPIDFKIFDHNGEPVFLYSFFPDPTTNMEAKKIWYLMVYQDKYYMSSGYERIGDYAELSHEILTYKEKTYYAAGYMRLVEVEEEITTMEDEI